MPTEPKVVAVIPARWASSRFPGKPLAKICNKPMIQWVVEQTRKARLVSDIIVATDDRRIFDAVGAFGGRAVMTSESHPSGSDRVAEVVAGISCDIVVNVQGDEPLIPPGNIDWVIEPLLKDRSLKVSTLMIRIQNAAEVFNPNIAKVATDGQGFALYFSRAPIPFYRDEWKNIYPGGVVDTAFSLGDTVLYKHIGLYAYTKSFLMDFARLPQSRLEDAEKLEQLRILANRIPLKVLETQEDSIGVDCVADLDKVERLIVERKQV